MHMYVYTIYIYIYIYIHTSYPILISSNASARSLLVVKQL